MRWKIVAVVLALAGCAQEMPYRTDADVARAIPRDRARAAVAELVGRARTWNGKPYEAVEVDDRAFAFRLEGAGDSGEAWRREYASLSPRLFRHAGNERVEVVLVAFEHRWQLRPGDSLWFDRAEDAERFLDAVASLGQEP